MSIISTWFSCKSQNRNFIPEFAMKELTSKRYYWKRMIYPVLKYHLFHKKLYFLKHWLIFCMKLIRYIRTPVHITLEVCTGRIFQIGPGLARNLHGYNLGQARPEIQKKISAWARTTRKKNWNLKKIKQKKKVKQNTQH